MKLSSQSQEVLTYIFSSGYKINLVPHRLAWSAHIFHANFQGVDSSKIYGGTAQRKDLAIAKAVSEFVERNALQEESERAYVQDSTGFAARPLGTLPPLLTAA